MVRQQTLAGEFALAGIGLHSGMAVTVQVLPASANAGRFFTVKLGDRQEVVPAQYNVVVATQLSTEIRGKTVRIRTTEHLLAALWGMGVDNAEIVITTDQPVVEIPIMDGSALPWVEQIKAVGVLPQEKPRWSVKLSAPVAVYQEDSFVMAVPSDRLQFSYGIDFASQAIGRQWFSWIPEQDQPFAEAIAPARTFTLAKYIEPMRSQGLIKGGSLENAIVCDDKTWLNPPLRFADEPCRHKLLDLIGDLSLLGDLPIAHYLAYKASHHLHCQLCQQLTHAHFD